MTDKELADKVAALVGRSGELAIVIDDAFYVRDWRVAGALMEKLTATSDSQVTAYHMNEQPETEHFTVRIDDGGWTCGNECYGDSLPRAIILACVTALT